MAKYREMEREPREVEAIFWTGENLDEVKDFLGENFVCVDSHDCIYFKVSANGFQREMAFAGEDMIMKYSDDYFSREWREDFLKIWEEAKEKEIPSNEEVRKMIINLGYQSTLMAVMDRLNEGSDAAAAKTIVKDGIRKCITRNSEPAAYSFACLMRAMQITDSTIREWAERYSELKEG